MDRQSYLKLVVDFMASLKRVKFFSLSTSTHNRQISFDYNFASEHLVMAFNVVIAVFARKFKCSNGSIDPKTLAQQHRPESNQFELN